MLRKIIVFPYPSWLLRRCKGKGPNDLDRGTAVAVADLHVMMALDGCSVHAHKPHELQALLGTKARLLHRLVGDHHRLRAILCSSNGSRGGSVRCHILCHVICHVTGHSSCRVDFSSLQAALQRTKASRQVMTDLPPKASTGTYR